MISDLELYRTANVLIRSSDAEMVEGVREHGDDAAIEAAMRADSMLEDGQTAAYLVWKRIVAAIEQIQRKERRDGEAVN